MAASLGSLVVSLGLDAAQFVDGMTKSERQARNFVRDLTSGAARAAGALAALGAATAAPIAALSAITGEMDTLAKASQRASMPIEAFSALAYAGSLADVTIESLTGAMGRLAKAQDAARDPASEQAKTFKALGIEVKNADGSLRDSAAVFEDFAGVFQKFEGSPEIVAAGMRIFGKGFQELIPLMRNGQRGLREAQEEARALGAVLSTEAAANAERFNDNLTRLQTGLKGVKNVLAIEALPSFVSLTDEMVRVAKEALTADGVIGQFARDGTLKSWAETSAIGIATVGEALYFVAKAIGVVRKAFIAAWEDIQVGQGLARNMFGGFLFESNRRALADALASRNATVAEFNQELYDLWNYDSTRLSRTLREQFAPQTGGPLGGASFSDARFEANRPRSRRVPQILDSFGAGGKSVDQAKRYLEQLQRQLEATQDLSVEEQLLTDIRMGRLGKVGPAQEAELAAIARQIDAARALRTADQEEARVTIERMNAEQAARERMLSEAARLYEQTRTPIEALNIREAELSKLLADGWIKWDTYARAVLAANDAYDKAIDKTAGLTDEQRRAQRFAEDLGMTFSSAAEDAIVKFEGVREVLRGLEQDLIRVFTRKLITEPFADWVGGIVKGGSSGGGGFTGWLSGLFGGARAAGGPVEAGRFYRVNESRSELLSVNGKDFLMAGAAGRVRPNPRFAEARDRGDVHVHLHGVQDFESFRRSGAQLAHGVTLALARGRRIA